MADLETLGFISSMDRATEVNEEALFETSVPDVTSETGYGTKGVSLATVSKAVLNTIEYTTELETEEKKIIPAINENHEKVEALKKVIDGMTVEFQPRSYEGDFVLRSGVIGSVLQGLKGKSEASKNLFDSSILRSASGSTFTINGNEITVKTTSAGTYRGCLVENIQLKKNTTYTISATVKSVSGGVGEIGIRYWNGTQYESNLYAQTERVTSSGKISRTFTTRSDTDLYQVFLFCTWSSSVNGETVYENIQLEEGSSITDFEPYYEGLKSVEVSKFETFKNYFDINGDINRRRDGTNETNESARNVLNSDGTITVNASGSMTYGVGQLLELKKGTYTFSIDVLSKGNGSGLSARVYDINNYTNPIYALSNVAVGHYSNEVNIPNDGTFLVGVYISGGTVPSNGIIKNIKFIENITPYAISFEGRSAGNVRDEINLVSKKYIKRVGVVDLGSLSWNMGSANRFASHDIDTLAKFVPNTQKANILCSLYSVDTATNVYAKTNDKTVSVSVDGTVYIYDTKYANASDFKTAMAGVELYYELAEEVITDDPQGEVLATVKAGDTIAFDSEIPNGSNWSELVFLKEV